MDSQILWDNIEVLKINQLTHKMRGNIPSSLWTILSGRMHKSLGAVRKCVFLKWGILRCILGFFCDLAHTSSEVHPWELQQDPRPYPAGKSSLRTAESILTFISAYFVLSNSAFWCLKNDIQESWVLFVCFHVLQRSWMLSLPSNSWQETRLFMDTVVTLPHHCPPVIYHK